MAEPAVEVVCFDLGGVVLRIARSWAEGCVAAGVELRAEGPNTGGTRAEKLREVVDAYQRGAIACEAYYAEIAERLAGGYTPAEVRRVHEAWVFGEYPGMAALIAGLGAVDGLRTACLSNTNHAHWTPLAGPDTACASPAIGALDVHLVSHELGAVKPDEAIYTIAERRLGVPPEAILFFDDLAENVAAARIRGWQAKVIDPAGDPAAQIRAHLEAAGVPIGAPLR